MTLLPVPRNCSHAIISLRRFSKAVRRLAAIYTDRSVADGR